jgi:tRNA A-37 threonylcarbamoyl transferase component Bud32/tetratricopeptide (TPR) repeat protein
MELIGRRFGHIRVTDVVGQGGMGDVYAAYDEKLERKVALKVLNADQRLDNEARDRLLREARALSRLDHPNICRIYDYIESDDVDLLVLEYIDGRTLYDSDMEKMARGEKLRVAIAISEVLVAAHRAGIVHRDLKPENVMLTQSGEVKVLDFGLARWLNRARTKSSDRVRIASVSEGRSVADTLVLDLSDEPQELDVLSSTGRREYVATQVGITLGTPLYMSPEQARGESLTPASDMFSFGLLLQWLFTGGEPHPEGLMARDVIQRVARGDTLPVDKKSPGDIASFIHRLKSFAPTDRPTAVEAVERLQFLHDKPQRIARRSAIAAAVLLALFGIWRYTVDLRAERTKALAAQGEAVTRRAQAEDLIEFMLGDLRKKLEPVGRVDVLNDVAERALTYSKSLDPAALSPQELLRNAKALHQLVQVRIAQGSLDAALEAAMRAGLLTDAAARRQPSADAQFAVAMSQYWIANVHRLRAELPQALVHAEAYRKTTASLAAQYPQNAEYQAERDYGEAAVATILELQGDLIQASETYQRSVARRRARVAADTSNPKERAQLAVALNKLGFVQQRLGRLEAAGESFREELAIYQALTLADPNEARWRERLTNSHSYLGGLFDATGDITASISHRREEIAIGTHLHEHDPANADWHRNLAIAKMRLGDLLRRSGDPLAGLSLIRDAEALLDELVARPDARKSWKKDLAIVRNAHARALLALNRNTEAVTLARRASQDLTALQLTDPLSMRHEAAAIMTLGEALAATGSETAARAEWLRSQTILAPLAMSSSDPAVLDVWARTLFHLEDHAGAMAVLQRLDSFGYRSRDLDRLRPRQTG